MENGWYAAFARPETRQECYARAKDLSEKSSPLPCLTKLIPSCSSHMAISWTTWKNFIGEEGVLDSVIRFAHTNTGISRVEVGKIDGMGHIMNLNESTHLEAAEHTGGEMVDGWGKWRERH